MRKPVFPTLLNSSALILLYGQFFLLFLACCFILPDLGFFAGLPITGFYLFASLIFSAGITWYIGKEHLKPLHPLIHLSVAIFVIITGAIIATFILDTSVDGQWYHQVMIFKLRNGWNPVYHPAYNITPMDQTNYIWVRHYPKCYHIIATCIYAITGHIESGKAINIFIVCALFFYSWYFAVKVIDNRNRISLLMALLISLNPVIVSQLLSYYIDGFLASLLCILVLQLLSLELIKDADRKITWGTIGVLIIMICNMKFTGVLISCVLLGAYSLYWWLTKVRTVTIGKRYLILGVFYVCAILLFGFNPYVTNYQSKGSPVYPTTDPTVMAIILHNQPKLLEGKPNAGKFLISLCSRADNVNDSVFRWKNPLTVTKAETRMYTATDVRLEGMGPYFLLAVILSLFLLVILCNKKASRQDMLLFGSLLSGILISLLVFRFSWWARFVPQLYLWVPIVLLMAFRYLSRQPVKLVSYFSYAIMFTLFVNIIIIAGTYIGSNIIKTELIRQELTSLKSQPDPVIFNFTDSYFQSSRIRLQEFGVPYSESDTLRSNTRELRTIYQLMGMGPKYRIFKK